ncbi:hypothetical protein GALL_103330 [mine drainage metagenome]|uniref:PRTase-CE domain-containing protein n=1 Tax=mine drainage metagenome TaxID=410659 RepID=A0A1J5T1E9_9ZZZZ
MSDRVSLSDVTRLRALFSEKEWNSYPNETFVFNNLCKLMDNLTKEQSDLIFELTNDFLWLSGSEYEGRFNQILNFMFEKIDFSKCHFIYLIPVSQVKDRNKIKSASHCVYVFKNLLSMNRNYSNTKKEIIEDYELLNKTNFKNDGTELIFFVDDFVGTGDTFSDCWLDITKNETININNSVLISLVLLEEGHRYITERFGLPIYYSELCRKGITDKYAANELEEKYNIMKVIESHCKPGKFTFGYKQSEALVSMSRTPNNTFPVFWKKSVIKRNEIEPPFPRL